MSSKLESKESHCFYIEDAQKHGVDKATILYNIRFWLNKEMANYNKGKPSPGKVQDGYVWTYNSAEAFSDLIPYFTPNKIQKLLKQLENDGIIITGKFNQKRYDKTKWYTMEEYSVEKSLQPNGGKDSAKRLKEISQTAEPIPDINTDRKPYKKNYVSDDTLADLWLELLRIWRLSKSPIGNKQKAISNLKKLNLNDDLLYRKLVTEAQKHSFAVRDLNNSTKPDLNLPNATTWLSQRRWEQPVTDYYSVNNKNTPPGSARPPRARKAFGE